METSEQFDVIIVGAGVMGSSTAYQTAKRGCKTLLLEQFDFLHHRGSSHGESRTIRATYGEEYYYQLVMESYKLWQQAEAEIGYKVYFKANHFDMGPADCKALQALLSTCKKHSIPHEVLDRQQVADKFSGRFDIPENWVGVFNELGGVIKPSKAVSMLQTLAIQHGATLKDNMQVVDIQKDESRGGILVSTANGKKIWGKKCVVTVGAWIKKIVKAVVGFELPVQALETHVCYWRVSEGNEEKVAIGKGFPTFAGYGEPYVYGTPSLEYPGLIKVAVHGGQPCDPDKRPWGSGVSLDLLKQWVERRLPRLVDSSEIVTKQICMYTMTPDEDFVIDFLGGKFEKDVVVGGGFSGHGFKMAPAIGRILAELALDGEANGVELQYFRIGRFEENPKGNVKDF